MPKNGLNVSLNSYDDIFSTEETRQEEQREQVQQIPIDELYPFKDHPFKVLDDEAMQRTVESIKQLGVTNPLIARPRPDGGYEIISGHRRQHAAQLARLKTLPVIVRDMSDDAAVLLMVDSNLQREQILPSERAFAYKMKLEAMKRQAGRPKNSAPLEPNLKGTRSNEELAASSPDSRSQIQRFIRLTELIPELLEKVDKGEIALRPAVDISYLPEDIQRSLLDTIEMEQCTPSYAQTRRMRTLLAEGKLTDEAIYAIMQEEKPNQKEKFTISASKIEKVLPQSVKASQREDFILKAIDYYAKHLQRKKEERER